MELAHDVGRLMRLDMDREQSRAALDYYQRLSQRALDRAQLSSAAVTDASAQVPLVTQRDGNMSSDAAERGWCSTADDVQHPHIFPYHCSWLCQWVARMFCCCPICCSYKQVCQIYIKKLAQLYSSSTSFYTE